MTLLLLLLTPKLAFLQAQITNTNEDSTCALVKQAIPVWRSLDKVFSKLKPSHSQSFPKSLSV